jgi:hypothetical protein
MSQFEEQVLAPVREGGSLSAEQRRQIATFLGAAIPYAFRGLLGAVSPTTTCLHYARLGQGTRALRGERLPCSQGG